MIQEQAQQIKPLCLSTVLCAPPMFGGVFLLCKGPSSEGGFGTVILLCALYDADILQHVQHKGQQHHRGGQRCTGGGHLRGDAAPEDVQHEQRIDEECRDLAVPARALDLAASVDGAEACDARCKLLDRKQHERPDEHGESSREAQQHGKLCQLIGDGVERLAELAGLVESPRNEPIRNIREKGQHDERRRELGAVERKIGPEEDRDQREPKHREDVRNGQDGVVFFLFGGLVDFGSPVDGRFGHTEMPHLAWQYIKESARIPWAEGQKCKKKPHFCRFV